MISEPFEPWEPPDKRSEYLKSKTPAKHMGIFFNSFEYNDYIIHYKYIVISRLVPMFPTVIFLN